MSYTVEVILDGKDNLSNVLKGADGQLHNLEQGAADAESGFGGLITGATIAGAAVAAIGFGKMVYEMGEVGDKLSDQERIFAQLTQTFGSEEEMLIRLRGATRGVVDDFTLMETSSQMLRMGVASNADELERFERMAVTLGGSASAVGDFTAMMANQSLQRLDTFGISSAAVRQEIEDLIATGRAANREEAFKLAVLDQGTAAMNRLGDAVDNNVDSVDILETKFKNFVQSVQKGAGVVVNAVADMIVNAMGISPDAEAEKRSADEFARRYRQALVMAMNEGWDLSPIEIPVGLDIEAVNRDFIDAINRAKEAGLSVSPNEILSNVLFSKGFSPDQITEAYDVIINRYLDYTGTVANGSDIITQEVNNQLALLNTYALAYTSLDRTSDGFYTKEQMRQSLQTVNYLNAMQARREAEASVRGIMLENVDVPTITYRRGGANLSGFYQQINESKAALEQFYSLANYGMFDFSDGAVAALEEQFVHIQELSKDGLISDADVTRAKDIHDRLAEVSKMGLSGLLGTTNGGAMGEIADQILASLPEGMRDEAQKFLDLASGRANDLSVVMENNVVPLLTELFKADPNMAASAMAHLTQILQEAKALGLSPGQTVGVVNQFTGQYVRTGGGGQTFSVKAGDTASALAAQYGVTPEMILAAAGAKDAHHLMPGSYTLGGTFRFMPDGGGQMNPNPDSADGQSIAETMAGYMADMATDSGTINDNMTAWTDNLDAYLATSKTLTLDVQLQGDQYVIGILKGGTVTGTIAGGGGKGGSGGYTKPQRPGRNATNIAVTH